MTGPELFVIFLVIVGLVFGSAALIVYAPLTVTFIVLPIIWLMILGVIGFALYGHA